jgi:rSAM/selenodomain-associated transferase 2
MVDGGSDDLTVPVAREFTDKVFVAKRGRGHQMNFGAERASGDVLLFLHVDCLLPDDGFKMIRDALSDERAPAGAFDLSIDHPALGYRIIEAGANMRSRLTSIPYGDQGIFMKKETFDLLGGFSDIPLMEDIELSSRLKTIGRITFLRPPIKTSPRRWQKEGPVYTTFRDWALAISYSLLGASPERLVKYYRNIR